jgi:hypothetical protein
VNTLLIGYDLRKPGQGYADLIAHLKTYDRWWHNLDSTWIIKTSASTVAARDAVWRHMDANDRLLVVELAGAGAWAGLSEAAS